jgi:hypothetical protein
MKVWIDTNNCDEPFHMIEDDGRVTHSDDTECTTEAEWGGDEQ